MKEEIKLQKIYANAVPPLVHHLVKQMKGFKADYLVLVGTEAFPLNNVIKKMYAHEKANLPIFITPVVWAKDVGSVGEDVSTHLKNMKVDVKGKKVIVLDVSAVSGRTLKNIKTKLKSLGANAKTAVLVRGKRASRKIDFVGAESSTGDVWGIWKGTSAVGLTKVSGIRGKNLEFDFKRNREFKKELTKNMRKYFRGQKNYIKEHMGKYAKLNEHFRV